VTVLETGSPAGKSDWNGAHLFRVKVRGLLTPRDRDVRTLLLNPRWRQEVSALIFAFGPQLLLTQGMFAPGAIQAARRAHVPAAYFFRGYAPFCPRQYQGLEAETDCGYPNCTACLSFRQRVKYPLVRAALDLYARTLPQAELIVANSRYVADLFDRRWNARAEVVLPAIGLDVAREPQNDPAGYLLFVKPQKIKGLDLVLELARRMPGWRFAVAGETRGRAARALARLANVDCLGWRDDMPAVYRGARLLLGPSIWPEPFGRVFAEAASVGCPSVAYRCGGIPEALGRGAIFLERDAGPAQWAEAIQSLRGNRYESLRLAALQHARALAGRDDSTRLISLLETTASRGAQRLPAPAPPLRRLKVAHIISALSLGGAELNVFRLVARLDRTRFEPYVVCIRGEGMLAERIRATGVPVKLLKMPSRYSPLGLLKLAQFLAREGIDIVHTHLRRPNTSGRIAAWLADTPVVIAHEENPGPDKTRLHFFADRLLGRMSSAVIAVSRQVAQRNSLATGLPLDAFEIMPNAVDQERFSPRDRALARASLGLDPGDFIAGFVGRLHPIKNVDVLVRAAALAARDIPAFRLLVAGDGPERPSLERLTSELGIADRTTFLGLRTDTEVIYSAMNLFCLVSRSEGYGMVLLEAAACGVPSIATPVGYAEQLLGNGQAGIIVPVGQPAPTAQAIVRLARNLELRDSMSLAARRAAEPHGLDAYVKRMERFYLELWNQRPG
jgi:glycosyltransferase involved in cell wall biosynthesis